MGFGPPICRESDTHISDMHFQIALTADHVAGYGWVPFSELQMQLTKKRKKKESVVKHKSADMYVRRPNNT